MTETLGRNDTLSLRSHLLDEPMRFPEMLGPVSSGPILDFVDGMHELGVSGFNDLLGPSLRMRAAVALYPLIEQATTGEITTDDVRPYRKAIKDMHTNAGCAASALGCLSLFPPLWVATIPSTMALNRRIERNFVDAIPDLMQNIRDQVARFQPLIDKLSQFENPRDQFTQELSRVLSEIEFHDRADGRTVSERTADIIVKIILDLKADTVSEKYPLLQLTVGKPLATLSDNDISTDRLGVAAPEIIKALEVTLDKTGLYEKAIGSPTLLRYLAKIVEPGKMHALDTRLPRMMCAIRDILPTSGADVRRIYEVFKRELNISNGNS